MLPGYISGFYSFDECHIDLSRLSQFAQARLIHAEACGVDLDGQVRGEKGWRWWCSCARRGERREMEGLWNPHCVAEQWGCAAREL